MLANVWHFYLASETVYFDFLGGIQGIALVTNVACGKICITTYTVNAYCVCLLRHHGQVQDIQLIILLLLLEPIISLPPLKGYFKH